MTHKLWTDSDKRMCAAILARDARAGAMAAELQRMLPNWRCEVLEDAAGLAGLDGLECFVGVIIAPQCAGRDAVTWVEQVTQACPGMLWVAVVDEQHREDPEFMKVVASTCHDFLTTPLAAVAGLFRGILQHAAGLARLRAQLLITGQDQCAAGGEMVGGCPAMNRLGKLIGKFARVDAPVMVCGESGTGKELVARAIHRASARAEGPFVAVNCGAIPENLLEPELFGHVKGAFTGAVQNRQGRAELAHGGTLFLDEIGDLSLSHQVKILRFLQEGSFERVGSATPVEVDVRIIAATHVDLEAAVTTQAFREDLFYRLNVLQIRVPPLRERGSDIKALAEHFLAGIKEKTPTVANGFSADAVLAMRGYRWPGNVRELINRVSKAAVMAEGALITPVDLDLPDPRELPAARVVNLQETRERAERLAIENALHNSNFNVSQAASLLGVSRMTIYRLLGKHGIEVS